MEWREADKRARHSATLIRGDEDDLDPLQLCTLVLCNTANEPWSYRSHQSHDLGIWVYQLQSIHDMGG